MNHYDQEIELYFELKGTSASSRESYSRRVKAFIKYLTDQHKCVDDVTDGDIQQYILYLKKGKGLSPGTINNYISSIKFFYTHVLDRGWNPRKVPRMKRIKHLPVIPPKQDVLAILNATTNLKHKAILSLIYGSGLRVSEVSRLKICDICSKTMRVRVDKAKHNTTRYTILSNTALIVLRNYFMVYFSSTGYKPEDWLFPGRNRSEHINIKTIKNTIIKLRNRETGSEHISPYTEALFCYTRPGGRG